MEEKKYIKVSLSTFFLIIAIIVIVILGYFTYKFYNEKNNANIEVTNLTSKLNNSESTINSIKNTIEESTSNETASSNSTNDSKQIEATNKYYENLSTSISKELKGDTCIEINLSTYKGSLSINNKKEAYIYLPDYSKYSKAPGVKIASNVVNAWYCEEGQDSGNEFILFLKTDGTVSYVRFSTDFSDSNPKTKFEDTEKTINGLTDISDVIPISGGDENGIGGLGVLIVKFDGTCLPYSTLDDLVKK